MRRLLPFLLASMVSLTVPLTPAKYGDAAEHGPAAVALPHAPRLSCERPRTLRLHRFEDGSAQLKCAGRIIARVSAPG
ncbi:MAG TPA: hypothetical protein VN179_03015 [Solirubrobacterales bacterium]|nr:hypothetical protein [Solirubrobacterales bacterium]